MASKTSDKSGKAAREAVTRQVLFIQGGGEGVHDQWDDKLVTSLEHDLGQEVRYPHMPEEGDPSLAGWRPLIEQEIADLAPGAVLVGHSVGGTLLIHVLAGRPSLLKHVAAICLVAPPFVGDGGWPGGEIDTRPGWAAPLAGATVYLYRGDIDDTVPASHLDLYARAIPHAQIRHLAGRDHQLNNDLAEVARDIRHLPAR